MTESMKDADVTCKLAFFAGTGITLEFDYHAKPCHKQFAQLKDNVRM